MVAPLLFPMKRTETNRRGMKPIMEIPLLLYSGCWQGVHPDWPDWVLFRQPSLAFIWHDDATIGSCWNPTSPFIDGTIFYCVACLEWAALSIGFDCGTVAPCYWSDSQASTILGSVFISFHMGCAVEQARSNDHPAKLISWMLQFLFPQKSQYFKAEKFAFWSTLKRSIISLALRWLLPCQNSVTFVLRSCIMPYRKQAIDLYNRWYIIGLIPSRLLF